MMTATGKIALFALLLVPGLLYAQAGIVPLHPIPPPVQVFPQSPLAPNLLDKPVASKPSAQKPAVPAVDNSYRYGWDSKPKADPSEPVDSTKSP